MKVVIADDHPLVRDSLAGTVAQLASTVQVLQAEDGEQVMALLESHEDTDLLLLDLIMPGSDGVALLEDVGRRFPELKVAVLSASENPADMRSSLDAGASGFIPKSSPVSILLAALRLILEGGVYVPPELLASASQAETRRAVGPACSAKAGITPRQREVLRLVAEGKSNKEIARSLDLSEHTVKIHVAAILRSLGVQNRTQAAMAARDKGVIDG